MPMHEVASADAVLIAAVSEMEFNKNTSANGELVD
jgi:hypothetical protein